MKIFQDDQKMSDKKLNFPKIGCFEFWPVMPFIQRQDFQGRMQDFIVR